MIDWSGVGSAVLRAEGRWWIDAVEQARQPDQTVGGWVKAMTQRSEEVMEAMLAEWRAAGVKQPLALYGVMTEASTILWTVALLRKPGATLQLMGLMAALGAGYGLFNAPGVSAPGRTSPAESRSDDPYGSARLGDRPGWGSRS